MWFSFLRPKDRLSLEELRCDFFVSLFFFRRRSFWPLMLRVSLLFCFPIFVGNFFFIKILEFGGSLGIQLPRLIVELVFNGIWGDNDKPGSLIFMGFQSKKNGHCFVWLTWVPNCQNQTYRRCTSTLMNLGFWGNSIDNVDCRVCVQLNIREKKWTWICDVWLWPPTAKIKLK